MSNPLLATNLSLILNRKDTPGQAFWTEWRNEVVLVGGTTGQAGAFAILGPNGTFDPSVIPAGGAATINVNGTPVVDPNFNNLTPAAPPGATNITWQVDGSGNVSGYIQITASTVSVNGSIVTSPNFNNSTPAAPPGFTNVVWQVDGSGNIAAYVAIGGGASDIVAFPDDTASDIPGYGILTEDPASIEQIGVATVSTTSVLVPFATENSYASPGGRGVDVIPAGEWTFDTWVSVDSTSGNAVCAVVIQVYSRTTLGVETLLFQVQTPQITTTSPQLLEIQFEGSDYFINPTDRIVIKYFGVRTSGNQTRTISFYHAGEAHLSRITAPIPSITFVPFNAISSGTNDQATMVVSAGATLKYDPITPGVLNANQVGGIDVAGNAPTHVGQLLISQPGNTTALWADPLMQGLYPEGSSVASPPPFATPTTIQPVLMGGKGTSPSGKDGLLHSLPLTAGGEAVYILPKPEIAQNLGNYDPYQRLRVSNPVTIFEESAEFVASGPIGPATALDPTQFTFITTGSGAFNRPAGNANITGTVGTDSGARAVWQTRQYFFSQLGKGFAMFIAANLGANINNVTTRVGAYDDDHGGFFEQNGTTHSARVCFRSNGVDQAIPQSAWNIDKMDGTGNSGITLNFANGQFFVIDVGVGRIRYGIAVNGVIYYVHGLSVTNAVPALVHAQSIVPHRFEILNTGTSTGGTIWSAYVSVIVESGFEDNPTAFAFTANTGTSLISAGASPKPILSIRPALLLNGHRNSSFITVRDYGVFTSGQITQYQLIWNGTLTGASFAAADPQSAVEVDTSATLVTGGRVVDSGFIASFNKDTTFARDTFPFRLPFTLQDIPGSLQDVYTLVVTGVNGNTPMVGGSFRWQEVR